MMNFNVCGFNESLKYAYHQFCKQDEEGREHSRRLLVKLKKFEAKSFDLAAQTQIAQHMKNQYEKMFMQQNPLLWAQLQRNIATDLELEQPLLILNGALQSTKNTVLNTSPNSSTSEQHSSLHEEGIWRQTPSPCPGTRVSFKQSNENLHPNINKISNNYLTNEKPTYSEPGLLNSLEDHSKNRFPLSYQDSHKVPEYPKYDNDFTPMNSSTPTSKIRGNEAAGTEFASASDLLINNEIKETEKIPIHKNTSVDENEIEQHDITNTTYEVFDAVNKPIDIVPHPEATKSYQNSASLNSSEETRIPFEIQLNSSPVAKSAAEVGKPFRLESESECGDDHSLSGPISGKNVGDEDSDSFWN